MKNPRRRASAGADLLHIEQQHTEDTVSRPEKQHQASLAALRASWLTRRYPTATPTARAIVPFLFPGETEVGRGELADDEEAELPTLPVPF
jgi:hypothetical protein